MAQYKQRKLSTGKRRVTMFDSGLDKHGEGFISLLDQDGKPVYSVHYSKNQKHFKWRRWSREHAMEDVWAFISNPDHEIQLVERKERSA